MKLRRAVMLLVCIILAVSFFGCNKADVNDRFFVKGSIEYDTELTDIQIFINGKNNENARVNADGTFEAVDLKKGDVISFEKEGYAFDDIKVEKSVVGIIVVPSLLSFDVVVNKTGNGTVEGDGTYVYGSEITLTFTPSEHYEFDGLYDGTTLISNQSSYSFQAKSATNYTAVFAAILYPVTINKDYAGRIDTVALCRAFGAELTLNAVDDDDYVFVKRTVNGIETTDKTYVFNINSENTIINETYIRRLQKPQFTKIKNEISWALVDGATGYVVTLDDEVIAVSGCKVDVTEYDLYTGRHTLSVTAIGVGFGNSRETVLDFDYVRPPDTPTAGILHENDKVYLSFNKVLGAVSYKVAVNGVYKNLDDYTYVDTLNSIKIDLSDMMTAAAEYTFEVIAVGDVNDSNASNEVKYVFAPKLSAPVAQINGDTLTWSHADDAVVFDIVLDGVVNKSGVTAGSLDLSAIVDDDGAEVKVVARRPGYTSAEVILQYDK